MNNRTKYFLYFVYFLSGISGLIYQTVWLRLLAEIFGSTTYALSTVLAAFMAGLSVGSWGGGEQASRSPSLVRTYVRLELGIGISAMVVTVLLVSFHAWYDVIYQLLHTHLVWLTLSQFVLGFILILLPTALMGATVPIMAQIIIKQLDQVRQDFSLLYALNTLGGMTGVILSSFFLLENVGLYSTTGVAILINLLVGGSVFLFARSATGTLHASTANNSPSPPKKIDTYKSKVPAFAFASGFIAFGLEILWTRSLVFYVGNTTYSFALILLLVLLGIALGSLVINRITISLENAWGIMGTLFCLIGAGVLSSLPLFHVVFSNSFFAS